MPLETPLMKTAWFLAVGATFVAVTALFAALVW
jgi:hypothetical protein